MAGLSRIVCMGVGLCLPAVACGARTGLLVPTVDAGPANFDAGCMGTPVAIDPNIPNLFFVLDVSTSMADMNKWENIRAVVGDLIDQLGPSAAFGAAVFPQQGTGNACSAGVQVLPLQRGDSQGTTTSAFLNATDFPPLGGTPTAATIEALSPELLSFRGPTFVILATDGGPNCDASLACDVTGCTSNIDGVPGCPPAGPSCCDPAHAGGLGCLDGERTVEAVSALQARGVETFVLGIPGSAPYASVLDEIAIAGGTARASQPRYYRADAADTGTLGDALGAIAVQTGASCVFTLEAVPADPGLVNVAIGGSIVHREGADGWTLAGAQLTLIGTSCAASQSHGGMPAPPVVVTQGCPSLP